MLCKFIRDWLLIDYGISVLKVWFIKACISEYSAMNKSVLAHLQT